MAGVSWGGMVAQTGLIPPGREPRPFRGGQGPRPSAPLIYPLVMTIHEDGIEVDYPTLGCGGILTPLTYSEGRLRTREVLNRGFGRCVDGVELVLQASSYRQIDADFFLDGRLVAKGTLVRSPDLR